MASTKYTTTGALIIDAIEFTRRDNPAESPVAPAWMDIPTPKEQDEIEEMLALPDMGTPCDSCFDQATFLSGGCAFCSRDCLDAFLEALGEAHDREEAFRAEAA
jgi:hypothetical protein